MNESTVHDDKLFDILKDSKNLPNFLDAVFGFLKRRTDFYYIATDPNSQVGLPEGLAEKIVKETFYKWKLSDKRNNEIVNHDMVPSAATEVIIEDTDVIESTDVPNKTSVEERTQSTPFTSAESYNGAVFENYSWSQTITEIDVIVNIPENITSKDLYIKILPQRITVKLKKDDTILLDGELCEKVKHNDALWSLDKQKLDIHLDKTTEFWWNCLVTHEPKIDIQNIDCSRPYEELSAEAQAKIEELSWNQERKRLGLPTSEELMLQNKLKHAWNAEGSPFKGPFDPNSVVFEHQ